VRKTEKGDDIICGIDCRGVHLYSISRDKMESYAYKQIEKCTGSSNRLLVRLISGWGEVTLWTSQAREMAALVATYSALAAGT